MAPMAPMACSSALTTRSARIQRQAGRIGGGFAASGGGFDKI
jgi:hypothetical protein